MGASPFGRGGARPAWRSGLSDEELGCLSGYPPLMTADEAARLLRISKSTLYSHVSAGRFRSAVKRGKPLLFFRDRLVRDYFAGR